MERVIPYSRYDYYKYYNAKKVFYKMNYVEKKRRNEIEDKHSKYYKDYWILSLWKEENMREYKKNNI
tara:strand:- start:125 stop:325 length:201 start_codon:yes stop_codon:yes gene_type:complete